MKTTTHNLKPLQSIALEVRGKPVRITLVRHTGRRATLSVDAPPGINVTRVDPPQPPATPSGSRPR